MPDSETAIRTCGDKGSFLIVVKGEVEHCILMTFELVLLLIGLHVEHLDGGVLVGDYNILVTFVKDSAVGA